MTITELCNKRAKTWEAAKAFLDSHRDKNGILTAEDTDTYERMEQDIVNLGKEIDRQERLEAFERELKAPTSEPLTSKPDGAKMDMKTGREVLSLMQQTSHELGITLILVTHDLNVAEQAERVLYIEDGQIEKDL